jgi:hypothetical protein
VANDPERVDRGHDSAGAGIAGHEQPDSCDRIAEFAKDVEVWFVRRTSLSNAADS